VTATLETICARLEQALADAEGLVWPAAALQEAVHLALDEYNLAAGAPCTLAGLDGAAETTLPEGHESIVIIGAAGYAAGMRGVERVEGFDPEGESPALLEWAQTRLGEFRRLLALVFPGFGGEPGGYSGAPTPAEQARRAGLRLSTRPPWGAWADDEGWS